MILELVALDGIKFQAEVYEVIIPTTEGAIAVYPGHMPLVTLASPGLLLIRKAKSDSDDKREEFAIAGGVIEVNGQTVRILVDDAVAAEEINLAEAQKAHDEAVRLRASAKTQVEIDKAQSLIDRQAVRLNVAGLKRRSRR